MSRSRVISPGEEIYSALYAIEESRIERGVIWTGSNDGPVYVTRDNGRTWKNVTPKTCRRAGEYRTSRIPRIAKVLRISPSIDTCSTTGSHTSI
ncbi:MAG: hypothetical protein IPM55_09280 [Acidobacteria bacterium]|nr:hypothetical protein [Acidobacteriota bacterium]